MKYNLNEKQTKGAKRVLSALGSALLKLLCEKPYESITVGEICNVAEYPRATFYNYFDDKDDILNYYWYKIESNLTLTYHEEDEPKDLITECVGSLYDMAEKHFESLKMLARHNPMNGYFLMSCRIFLTDKIKCLISNSTIKKSSAVPTDILAEYYISTLLIVLFKCLSYENQPEIETVKKYLFLLINGK